LPAATTATAAAPTTSAPLQSAAELQREVRRILALVEPAGAAATASGKRFQQHKLDAVVMHPVWGLAILAIVLFLIFQAVFSWANVPMDAIKAAMAAAGQWVTAHMADGPLRSLLVDGVNRRHGQRDRVPAADPDPVLLHSAARVIRAICRAPRSCSTT